MLFAADFSKVSARNQQGDSKGAAREQQGDSKKILGQGVFSARPRMRSCACAGMEPSASRRFASISWRFRSTLRVSRNDVSCTGQKREKMGGGDRVSGNGAPFPAAHLFPSPHPATHVIPPPTIGGGGIPSSPVSAAAVAESPPMTDV